MFLDEHDSLQELGAAPRPGGGPAVRAALGAPRPPRDKAPAGTFGGADGGRERRQSPGLNPGSSPGSSPGSIPGSGPGSGPGSPAPPPPQRWGWGATWRPRGAALRTRPGPAGTQQRRGQRDSAGDKGTPPPATRHQRGQDTNRDPPGQGNPMVFGLAPGTKGRRGRRGCFAFPDLIPPFHDEV